MALQTRWFAEPVHCLTFGPNTFQENRAGFPSLSKNHQDMLDRYMRLKTAPWMVVCDLDSRAGEVAAEYGASSDAMATDFPSLAEAHSHGAVSTEKPPLTTPHLSYLRHLERQQLPFSELEASTLTSFQDWLQSPLQPLSDNLESSTYEMFEGDPVKYDLYERAITRGHGRVEGAGESRCRR